MVLPPESFKPDASPMTTITSPIDLLSAIPFLIGYQPKDSIVLLALENDSISSAIRIDFPESMTPAKPIPSLLG